MSEGVVDQSWVSLSLSLGFWLSLSLSLGNVNNSDRVGQISATGSIAVWLVGSNSGGGGLVAMVASGVAGGQWSSVGSDSTGIASGVASGVGVVAGLVEAMVSIGPVEHSGVGLSLSGSQGSATDHNSNPDHGSSSTFQ